jgi:prepilin-type processing-associated H-X9-DG protein
MGQSRAAFTLIELLVTTLAFAAITAVACAGYAHTVRSGRVAQAMSDMRQLGAVALAYAADNDSRLPQSSHQGPKVAWTTVLKRSVPARLFRNPLDESGRANSYAINDLVTERPYGAEDVNFSRLQNIPAPSQTLLFGVRARVSENSDHFHFASEGWTPAAFEAEVWTELFSGAGLYLFVDGHVERRRWDELRDSLLEPGNRLVHPDGQPSTDPQSL